MATNHIFLLIRFIEELKGLARAQHWIDAAREVAPRDQAVQLQLDRYQTQVVDKKMEIEDRMFEISRSN